MRGIPTTQTAPVASTDVIAVWAVAGVQQSLTMRLTMDRFPILRWESGFHRMHASPKAAIVSVALKTINCVCQ
ncbi:hypothetical protein AGR8A_pTi10055 [Agrobacterium fabrum str. J-07]|nr:hypothetical protein AGR8A_pTi10055 [Agrobacterium fabrum str. J-07]